MIGSRFNISAAYGLAESARNMILDHKNDRFLEDYVDSESIHFWDAVLAPQKRTLLHYFLEAWEDNCWFEDLDNIIPSAQFDFIQRYVHACGLHVPTWFSANDIDKHPRELRRLLRKAFPIAANAAFQLLFQDREFLLEFGQQISRIIARYDPGRLPSNAAQPVPRCSYIPVWLKKGVFHRDKGICQSCGRDVSGLLNLDSIIHLDHVLPLCKGGTNDSTNFQLLCSDCNLVKGGRPIAQKNINHAFW